MQGTRRFYSTGNVHRKDGPPLGAQEQTRRLRITLGSAAMPWQEASVWIDR